MMRTAGVYLIFAAVALRGVVLFAEDPNFGALLGLLAVYGFILIAGTWIAHRKPLLLSRTARLACLLLQSILVIWLLDVTTYEDFFALLFIPPSLDVVSLFGRRWGFIGIALFSIALISVMFFSDEGRLFGLAMGILYGGICFLFGGYAHQVLKAEAASTRNKCMFNELRTAHHQLQGYADQVANLAVEQERNRLARDLHDSVTQTVFSMNLAAQSARLLLEKDPHRVSGQLSRLEELSANAQREIQSLVSQLKPRSLVQEGLPSALRRLTGERLLRDGLHVSLEIQGESTLSDAESHGLHSIASEALTNVVKHSGERAATIRLKLNQENSSLEIEDHGLGFDPGSAQNQRGHLGLVGMSERAREIGWSLSVESGKGRGTRILLTQDRVTGQVRDQK